MGTSTNSTNSTPYLALLKVLPTGYRHVIHRRAPRIPLLPSPSYYYSNASLSFPFSSKRIHNTATTKIITRSVFTQQPSEHTVPPSKTRALQRPLRLNPSPCHRAPLQHEHPPCPCQRCSPPTIGRLIPLHRPQARFALSQPSTAISHPSTSTMKPSCPAYRPNDRTCAS